MPTISRILVPLDFSACSDVALQYAVFLAQRFDAAVELLHVWEWPRPVPPSEGGVEADPRLRDGWGDLRDRIDREMDARLETTSAARVAARGQVEQGEPKSTILRAAGATGCDLIVLGTHGRRGLARVLLGSVAEEIVRRSPVPVMVVHEGETP